MGGNIFDNFLTHPSLFINKEVMRHSHSPKELPHRDMEIKALKDENKQLKATIDTLKHLNKSKQGKSRNSWKRSQRSILPGV